MNKEALLKALKESKTFFDRSSACLTEEDSTFAPKEGLFTAAQQVAHAGLTVDWFFDGAFGSNGFNMDFEEHDKVAREATSLTEARKLMDRAFADALATLEAASEEELEVPIADKVVMTGAPRSAIVGGIVEHTAHHRGVLTVYARLCGHEPAMPYM